MSSLSDLGTGLRRLREERQWTASVLAEKTGVRVYKLREYEEGVGMMVPTLGQILDALDANLCDLEQAIAGTLEPSRSAQEEVHPRVGSLLDTPETLGLALRLLRQTKGVSAAELGAKLDIVEESVYAVELSRENLRVQTLERLLDGLGATLSELHETLVLADFLRQREISSDRKHLRLALQCLGLGGLPSRREIGALHELQQLAEQLAERWG